MRSNLHACHAPDTIAPCLTLASSEKRNHAINGNQVRNSLGASPGIVGRTNAKRVPKIEMKLESEDGDSWISLSKPRSSVSTSIQDDGMPAIPRTKNTWKRCIPREVG